MKNKPRWMQSILDAAREEDTTVEGALCVTDGDQTHRMELHNAKSGKMASFANLARVLFDKITSVGDLL